MEAKVEILLIKPILKNLVSVQYTDGLPNTELRIGLIH